MSSSSLSASASLSAISVFCDFLEAAVQSVLFVRGLYPEAAFVRRRGFGRALQVVRHPALRAYIAQLVAGVREALQRWREKGGGGGNAGSAAALKFVLVVLEPSHRRCLERFVFDCRLPHLPPPAAAPHAELHTAGGGRAAEAERNSEAVALSSLRSQLSDALSKLSLCHSLLTALPDSQPPCTFTLLLYSNSAEVSAASARPAAFLAAASPSPTEAAPSWLPVELSHRGESASWAASPSAPWLIEIRSIRSPLLECEVYIQEAADKQKNPLSSQQHS